MILEELKLLQRALYIIYPCNLKKQAEQIINREIKLKTMDPRLSESEDEARLRRNEGE